MKIKSIGARQDIKTCHNDEFIGESEIGKKLSPETPLYQIEVMDDGEAYSYFTVNKL